VRVTSTSLHTLLFSEWRYVSHRRAIALSLQRSAQPPSITPALSVDNEDDDDARFQADLARAIAASKVNLSPTTSIASLSSDPSQISDLETAPPSASAVDSHTNSSFLAERAQLEQQRLARLKRLRSEPHSHCTGPPSKRGASSRETSCTPASGVGSSRPKGTVDEEPNLFWDGELRQTANKHVELGTGGKPVFRLSQIIGDVSLFDFLLGHLRQ
jgi:tyrosyl-DNA phosphodiesterase-1